MNEPQQERSLLVTAGSRGSRKSIALHAGQTGNDVHRYGTSDNGAAAIRRRTLQDTGIEGTGMLSQC